MPSFSSRVSRVVFALYGEVAWTLVPMSWSKKGCPVWMVSPPVYESSVSVTSVCTRIGTCTARETRGIP
ncbi:hypothetical protein [Streptomyces sp. NPDC054837]